MKMFRRSIASKLIVIVFLSSASLLTRAQEKLPDYKNPNLSIEKRVDDLISRMTLEEKIAQMQNSAPAVERLGIAQYDWWNEALHGVARAGTATVFPQAIGLAATFNANLMNKVADVISTEARAKYNYFQSRNELGRYKGLTFSLAIIIRRADCPSHFTNQSAICRRLKITKWRGALIVISKASRFIRSVMA